MSRGLKCIGICSWGYIHKKEDLVNQKQGEFNLVKLV